MAEITVGDGVINVPDNQVDVSVSMAPQTTPSVGEMKDMTLAQKGMLKVAVPSVTVPTVGIVGDHFIGHGPFHDFFLKAYAIVNFAIFAMGMVLLLLSVELPRVPTAVGAGKKLMWVAIALIYIAHGLKITIHAIY